jgi:hypothetical protein
LILVEARARVSAMRQQKLVTMVFERVSEDRTNAATSSTTFAGSALLASNSVKPSASLPMRP